MKIVITADGRNLTSTTGGQPLTSGSVGIEAAFILSADYDGLAVTAVFSTEETRVDVLLTESCCIVPWEVLQKPGTTLFVGVVGKNGSGEIVIPTVWGRVGMIECGTEASGIDPEDPTPDIAAQILEQARAALAEAAETKEAAAQSAQDAADDADRAEEAKQAAETAQGAAETAQTAAEAARDAAASSATAAAGSAATATQQAQAAATAKAAAETAQTAAETAQGAAETAQTAAESARDAAASSATDAAGSATTAAQSAQDAADDADRAEAAKQAAETAQGAAETAQTAAEAARDAAASSATDAAGSATTATQQAQAAATARSAAEAAQQAAETAKNYAQTFTGAPRVAASAAQMTDTDLIYVYTGTTSGTLTTGHWYYWDGSAWTDGGVYNSSAVQTDTTLTVSGAPADAKATGDAVDDLKSAVNDPVTGLDTKAPVIIDTASGAIASFEDGADNMPLKSLLVNIEPVQAAGTPSPENPLPISGWTGCNIHVSPTTTGGTVYPISWQSEAGTVYGGTLDVTSGVLTVDQVMVDMGDLTWVYEGVVNRCNRFYTASLSEMKLDNSNLGSGLVCSIYKIDGAPVGGSGVNNTICHYDRLIFVNNNAYSNADTFKAAMSGAQLVYELATPQVYQLTPTEVNTLLGTNNIWADCGSVDVDYPADTKLFIQKVNKPTDDDMTADAQIASGKYFIIGNNLYLSTTTIPAGDTIIPGTNCTKTNLAEALNALNS